MFPAPIVIKTSPGLSPSSNAAISWSRDSQNFADSPRAPIFSASVAETVNGSEPTCSRAANTGASKTSSASAKLAAKSSIKAVVRET